MLVKANCWLLVASKFKNFLNTCVGVKLKHTQKQVVFATLVYTTDLQVFTR
jgi:hypothetical protein